MKSLLLTTLPIIALTLANPVQATPAADAANACLNAIENDGAGRYDGADYRLRSIRGGSRKRVRFQMRLDELSETVECRYVPGEVTEITWPEIRTATAPIAE